MNLEQESLARTVLEQLDAYDLLAHVSLDGIEYDPERLREHHPLVLAVSALAQTFPQAVLPLHARRYWNILLRINSFGFQDDSFTSTPDEVIDTVAQAVSDFAHWLRQEIGQPKARLPSLTEVQAKIFKHVDENPRKGAEIAELSEKSHDQVRQVMTILTRLGLVTNIHGQGYIRTSHAM